MNRKVEYFTDESEVVIKDSVGNIPLRFFPQERDWTCSIACIRTLLSKVQKDVPDESYLIKDYNLTPNPYYSKDIKLIGILNQFSVIYGCDVVDKSINLLIDLLFNNYFIMVESMINFDHWLVLIAYICCSNSYETNYFILYDPYYNELKQIRVDEFAGMWCSGNFESNGVKQDFIAIKG